MNTMEMMLKQMLGNNPMFQRAKQMAEGKNEQELKQIASNLCKQRGIDFEEAYKQFQTQMNQMSKMFRTKN